MDNFDWRVSIATIAQAGPFSAFPGIDRVITLLDGAGVHLQADGVDHRLDTSAQPFAFSGDLALDCTLLGGGPCTDFNVMTRRSRFRADVQVVSAVRPIPASDQGLLMALRGTWQLQAKAHDFRCAHGQGLWWDAPASWQATPLEANAQLIWVSLHGAEAAGN
jgi:environmental stress-induced protein Ves